MTRFVALALVVAAVSLGCQSYDMEPVTPLALRSARTVNTVAAMKARPDLMLMVDKSGSMNLPIDAAASGCPAGCGTSPASPCPSTCPTRWSELVGAMGGFLTSYGDHARLGLAPFAGPPDPATPQCTPGFVDVDVSTSNDVASELQAQALAINAEIGRLIPKDGTPTSSTLQVLSSYAPLSNPDRDDYVLLLTDGLPNCNPNNANSYLVDPVACRCTDPNTTNCGLLPRELCLDQDATVAQIGGLKDRGVKTIVVGFGAETASGYAPSVLTAMGQAGGYTLTCPHGLDSECAGGTCNVANQTCSNTYYQASDGAALSAALARLAETLLPDPCKFALPLTPSDPKFISVTVDGQPVASGPDTWQYVPPEEVDLVGSLCDRAKTTTTLKPMDLQIGVVQVL